MAITFFPFDEGPGANVREAQWSQMARHWRGDGVLPDGNSIGGVLEVLGDGSTLSVDISPGSAWIQGHFFQSDSTINKVLNPVLTAGNTRIDIVTVRLDWIENIMDIVVLEGVEGVTPTSPSLEQNFGTRWEIPLARVTVEYGATTGDTLEIIDLRTPSINGDIRPVGQLAQLSNPVFSSSTSYQKFFWGQTTIDNAMMTDLVNDRIIAKRAGLYLASFRFRMGVDNVINVIAKNDDPAVTNLLCRGEGMKEGEITWIGNLNQGDTVSAYIYNNTGSDVTWTRTNDYTPSLTLMWLGEYAGTATASMLQK